MQHEFKKRKNVNGYKTGNSCFSGKIICDECGSFYGSKVWHSTSKYRRTIWQCNHKFKNHRKCQTPHHKCVEENAHSAPDQQEYQQRYTSLTFKDGLELYWKI